MSLTELISNNLTGEPLKDAIIIAILGATMLEFVKIMFTSVFSIFKR